MTSRTSPTTHQHCWGVSKTLWKNRRIWCVQIEGVKRSASSLHLHTKMANHFFVIAGRLEITVGGCAMRRLDPGEHFTAGVMLPHRMIFLTDTIALETYYAIPGERIDEDDIVRISPGWEA